MASFTALNVEPEDNIEEEVDDTKEIQLEEAFKLYQNALKLQSQGPDFFPDAFEAYQQLFRSEIFKYPEGISDFNQDQIDDTDPAPPLNDVQTLSALPANVTETAASSLPQLIYLAYKNRGEFVLDVERDRVQKDESTRTNTLWHLTDASRKALSDFAEALERDDTDIDLWKKAARVAEIFASQRIVRFCLESVLAGDDDAGDAIDLSGLDEAYAAGQLKEVVNLINDDLSRQQNVDVKPKDVLLRLLQRRNDPYPYLPFRAKAFGYTDDQRRPIGSCPVKTVVQPTTRSWLGMSQAVLKALVAEQENEIDFGPGGALHIKWSETPDAADQLPVNKSAPEERRRSSLNLTENTHILQRPEDITTDGAIMDSPEKDDTGPDDKRRTDSRDPSPKQTVTDQPRSVAQTSEDANDHQAEAGSTEKPLQNPSTDSISLPTRKRSSTVAGNEEPNEVRTKSKRLRARESMVENGPLDEEVIPNLAQYYQDQLEDYAVADRFMLNTVNALLGKLGLEDLGSLEDLRRHSDPEHEDESTNAGASGPVESKTILASDLRQALASWNDNKSQAILYGHGNHDFGGGKAGLTLFMQHSKASSPPDLEQVLSPADIGLDTFTTQVNSQWSNIHDVTYTLLQSLLSSTQNGSDVIASSYIREKWSNDFKQSIVLIIVRDDEYLFKTVEELFYNLDPAEGKSTKLRQISSAALELSQALFELHLDIYCSITNPNSQVDPATRIQQRERLGRWADLVSSLFNVSAAGLTSGPNTDLLLRFLWTSTTFGNKAEEVAQEHIMICLRDLRMLLDRAGNPTITLPNNLALPEISVAAIDQEISRLSTLDFFMNVFDSDNSEAVDVIERLEPILELTLRESFSVEEDLEVIEPGQKSQTSTLVAFLESGDASLKLYLWKRLQNAYQSISYTPKVVSCQLRAIETISRELATERHLQSSASHRQDSMLKWLRDADDLVAKVVVKILNESSPLECIDEDHLRSSMSAVACLLRLLHGFVLYEDLVRVGQVAASSFKTASSNKSFEKSKDRFREMLVRLWTLQYLLLKDATIQCPDLFPSAADDLADYLRSVHVALGIRQYCRYSNKIFLKLAKSDLLATQTEEDYSADVSQVLYDLHGLKFATGVGDFDHGCPPETLDKKTALQLVPVVMLQANRINIRDFQKSDLKGTIDKVQQALGAIKPSPILSHNKRVISSYLKSAINPKNLYDCLKGVGDLSTKPMHGDSADIASHGWYFQLGHIALAKYKSVKRVNPTPSDDLDVAATLFRQDLDHGTEKWETWYRLAQIYEAKIEDDLIRNSTKLNEHRQDVAVLERNSINAFTMSLAVALRSADFDHSDTAVKLTEMLSEFALRLYSSSREPLNMEAFKTDKQIRHLSKSTDQTMYKARAFSAMDQYSVWKFAAYLLSRKPSSKPRPWTSFYTLGKCLWKMFCNPDPESNKRRVAVDEVLEAFIEAIEALPAKKEKANEYILEPHFKLVSTVHKLVHRGILSPAQGVEYLQSTSYARKARLLEDDQGPEWDRYILEVLKNLGDADKSNWHHRIIARAAHVIYDDQPDIAGALGAKHEFTQQIFTKTMTLQVWKPEHERPGRHYVYTGRYVRFFVSLLNQLNDRSSLDQLLRRIRRRPTDFLDHTKIWEEVTVTYVKLLRRLGKIPEGHDKIVFDSLSHEDFVTKSEKLESWSHDPDTTSTALDILRDAIELKKLNNSLMKGTMIDDLVVDTYAAIYEAFVSQLPQQETAPLPLPPPPPATPMPQPSFVTMKSLNQGMPVADGRMSVGSLLTQTDGPTDMRSPPVGTIGLGLQTAPMVVGTPPPSSAEAPRIPTPAKSGRAKQITKVELRRRAESLLVKPPPIKTPVLSKKPVVDLSTPIRNRGGSLSVNLEAEIDGQAGGGSRLDEIKDEEEAAVSRASSRRGSLHDSADDESELSEAEGGDDETEKAETARLDFHGSVARTNGSWNQTVAGGEDGDGDGDGDGDDETEDMEDEEQTDQEREKDEMDVDGASDVEIQDSQELNAEKA